MDSSTVLVQYSTGNTCRTTSDIPPIPPPRATEMAIPSTSTKGVGGGGGEREGGGRGGQVHHKSKFSRRTPGGFREGDEGYGDFALGASSVGSLDAFSKKRAEFNKNMRDARRRHIVETRELQEYVEVASKVGNRKTLSNWLSNWLPGGSMGASETETSDLSEEESRGRKRATDATHDSIALNARSGADAEGVSEQSVVDRDSPEQSQDKVPKFDSSPFGSLSHVKRAERSWARKALQSAMMESKSKSKHTEWYH